LNRTKSDSKAKEQVATFAAESSYKDIDGNEITIPRVTARVELRVSLAISNHIERIKEKDWGEDFDPTTLNNAMLVMILPKILEIAPDILEDVASAITGISSDTILDTFDIDTLIDIISPFLSGQVSLMQKLMKVM